MAIITAILLFLVGALGAAVSRLLADEFKAWIPWIIKRVIRSAIVLLPPAQRDRFAEEWQSHINELPGEIGKLIAALDFPRAALKITLTDKEHKSLAARCVVRGTDGVHVVKEYAGPISFLDESVIVDSGVLVYGDVRALNVEIRPNAAVNGNVFARDTVTLFNKCRMVGDVTTRKISIEEGSFLKGVLDIRYQEVNRGKSAV